MFRNQKQFFHPNKKNIFRFQQPKKKNIFRFQQPKQGIFMTKSLLLFSAGRLFRQLVDCFVSIKWVMEMKQNVSESETVLSSKQKNIFSDSSTQTKKKYFQIPATQTRPNPCCCFQPVDCF